MFQEDGYTGFVANDTVSTMNYVTTAQQGIF